jgi:hypothetical protein
MSAHAEHDWGISESVLTCRNCGQAGFIHAATQCSGKGDAVSEGRVLSNSALGREINRLQGELDAANQHVKILLAAVASMDPTPEIPAPATARPECKISDGPNIDRFTGKGRKR